MTEGTIVEEEQRQSISAEADVETTTSSFSTALTKMKQASTIEGKSFRCLTCLKAFTRKTNLNNHAKIHTGLRPFNCLSCPKVFASKSDLRRHSISHRRRGTLGPLKTDLVEKPFKCDTCHKTYCHKSDLNRHKLRVHAGLRPYVCLECHKCFTQKSDLNRHSRLHMVGGSLTADAGRND